MKKIIAILVVTLAFGFSANAQQKKAATKPAATKTVSAAQATEDIKQLALKDVAALGEVVKLSNTQKDDFLGLFEYKHRHYADNLSAERRAGVAQTIEAKIKASLSPDDISKLEAKPGLMKKLVN